MPIPAPKTAEYAPAPFGILRTLRRNLRWIVAVLLCAVTIINYVDRQTLSVIAPIVRNEFRMSNTDYARIVFSFQLAYAVMQMVSGIIIDKLGTRLGFALFLVWWSVATILHRFANGVMSFSVFRFLLGVGEAGNWPAAIKAISEWFPAKERAFATGVFNMGSSTGAMFAPPLVAWIVVHLGWRESFLIAGSLGFVWLIFWWIFYRLPRQHPGVTPEELHHIESGKESVEVVERAERLPWLQLLKYRQVWGMVLARFLADPVWWFYLFWLPEYLWRQRHMDIVKIGFAAAIPYITADIGCLVGGGASSLLMRRGWNISLARKSVMVASAMLMVCAPFVVRAESNWTAVALVSLATFAHQSWSVNMLTLPADLFPQRVVASVSGLTGTGAAVGGMLFTLLTGYVVDHFSYTPIFTAAGLMHPIAAMLVLLIVGKIRLMELK